MPRKFQNEIPLYDATLDTQNGKFWDFKSGLPYNDFVIFANTTGILQYNQILWKSWPSNVLRDDEASCIALRMNPADSNNYWNATIATRDVVYPGRYEFRIKYNPVIGGTVQTEFNIGLYNEEYNSYHQNNVAQKAVLTYNAERMDPNIPSTVSHLGLYTNDADNSCSFSTNFNLNSTDIYDGKFHTLGFDWYFDYNTNRGWINYYLDNKEIGSLKNAPYPDCYLIIQLYNPNQMTTSQDPSYLYIDYISYTPFTNHTTIVDPDYYNLDLATASQYPSTSSILLTPEYIFRVNNKFINEVNGKKVKHINGKLLDTSIDKSIDTTRTSYHNNWGGGTLNYTVSGTLNNADVYWGTAHDSQDLTKVYEYQSKTQYRIKANEDYYVEDLSNEFYGGFNSLYGLSLLLEEPNFDFNEGNFTAVLDLNSKYQVKLIGNNKNTVTFTPGNGIADAWFTNTSGTRLPLGSELKPNIFSGSIDTYNEKEYWSGEYTTWHVYGFVTLDSDAVPDPRWEPSSGSTGVYYCIGRIQNYYAPGGKTYDLGTIGSVQKYNVELISHDSTVEFCEGAYGTVVLSDDFDVIKGDNLYIFKYSYGNGTGSGQSWKEICLVFLNEQRLQRRIYIRKPYNESRDLQADVTYNGTTLHLSYDNSTSPFLEIPYFLYGSSGWGGSGGHHYLRYLSKSYEASMYKSFENIQGDISVEAWLEDPAPTTGYNVTLTTQSGGGHSWEYGDLYYSLDDGSNWTKITSNMSGNIIPNVSQIKFRATASGYAGSSSDYMSVALNGNQVLYKDSTTGSLVSSNYILSADSTVLAINSYACFAEGTLIKLADGTDKRVEDITYDDELLVWDFYEGKLSKSKPCWIKIEETINQYHKITLDNGIVMRLVGPKGHRLFSADEQKMLYSNEIVGHKVYTLNGIATVLSCETINEEVKYYNLTTEKYLDCFADNVLTGSRLNNMYHISDMKYDSDIRLISEEEEKERWAVREALRK